jgi:hypothetical protein
MAEPPRIARFWSAFASIVALFVLSYLAADSFLDTMTYLSLVNCIAFS